MLFWTGVHPHDLPFREVIVFNRHSEEIFDEYQEMMKAAVAEGVAEVLDNIDL